MFIPIYKNPEYKVGDIVISLKSLFGDYYYFTPYHEFIIVNMTDKYNCTLKDIESEIEIEKNIASKDYTLKTDIRTAIERNMEVNDYIYFNRFIKNNCPYLTQEIDDREYYDACSIDKSTYVYPDCKVKDSCLCHINKYIKDDKIIKRYLRRKKLKNINNKNDE